MVKIKGIQKTSLIDYPGKVCSVVFLPECNFRCPFCQNPDLIINPEKIPDIREGEFFDFLESRKKWVDGVSITGGEPCIHRELPAFIKKIKDRGFLVKLDTNGTNPEMLNQLIREGLVDYIAMDIKAPLYKYNKVCGIKVDIEKIQRSIDLIIKSGIEHEMRSTVLPKLHSKQDIIEMAKLIKNSGVYFLQQFSPKITLDPEFQKERAFKEEELREIQKECNRFVKTEVRI